jgi:hypothetical protein
MLVGLIAIAVAASGVILGPDIADAVCTAAENLPCRPLTLECLFAGAGGLAAGLPAVPPGWGGFPTPDPPRRYAPDPAPGYEAPTPPSPQDALNDPEFQRLQRDYARSQAERQAASPPVPSRRTDGQSAADVLVQSIRHSGERR